MKVYLVLSLLASIGTVNFGAVEVISIIPSQTVDLNNQSINFVNCEEKMAPLESLDLSQSYTINLGDNYIDDEVIESLLSLLERSKLIRHLETLDLTNNRISREGLVKLVPLIQQKTFHNLVVPINCLDVADIGACMHVLRESASSIAPEHGMKSDELAMEWMTKVIWLPESYDLDKLPLDPAMKASHKAYYAKE